MATYYVRTDGSNSNAGTGPATNQAWQTVTYALANMVLTNGTNYLYIAPGVYRGSATLSITPSSTQTLVISGDPTAAQFTGVTAGIVRMTNFTSDTTNPSNSTLLTISGKTYTTIQNISFDYYTTSHSFICVLAQSNPDYININNCSFVNHDGGGAGYAAGSIRIETNTSINSFVVNRCSFTSCWAGVYLISTASASTNQALSITNCLFIGGDTDIPISGNGINRLVYNCTFIANRLVMITSIGGQTNGTGVYNCLFYRGNTALNATVSNAIIENYNRIISAIPRVNIAVGANSQSAGICGIDFGYALMNGIPNQQMLSSLQGSPNTAFGTLTGAPATDMYGVTWTGATPDAGSATYRSLSAIGSYLPTERNSSLVTIAPGATSQSIEIYLGATGLTASTSGLSARYNRTRTASVSIPLVARTIAQAWTAGGFAEVDSTNMPGVYRLDLPDAALAAGADDVTVVVRGASGTNGAVISIRLATSGLTSTETAQAVWNATASSYNTAGSMGSAGQDKTGYSLSSSQTFNTTGSVGSVTSPVTVGTNNDKTGYSLSTAGASAVSGKVWDETRASHTTAGTFGEYVNAELVTPVSQASLVRMGPFQVIADGVTTPMPLDVQKGAQHGVDIQCVDNNLSAIDITGATVTAKVYNSGGSLVDTYSCTATYAADGRATFTIDTTVTNTPGTYTATITRTTGASDTQVFGPLRIYVRDI